MKPIGKGGWSLNPQTCVFKLRRSAGYRFLESSHRSRQPDCKSRAATMLALDHDVPAHHLTEPTADSEAKPCAAVFARRGGRSLGKLLEQPAHLLRRHADTGVGHCEGEPVMPVLVSLPSGDGDNAFFGELVGVTRQVQHRLPEAGLVGVERA